MIAQLKKNNVIDLTMPDRLSEAFNTPQAKKRKISEKNIPHMCGLEKSHFVWLRKHLLCT